MLTYETLESTKYWEAALVQEYKELRSQKRREAFGSFIAFTVTLLMIVLVFYSYIWMPVWVESAPNYLRIFGGTH